MKSIKSLIALVLIILGSSSPALASSFADVVFVVDQSGSMYNEFNWISESLRAVDAAITDAGISATYGLAGFEYTAGSQAARSTYAQNAWTDLPSDIDTVVSEAIWAAGNLYGGLERSYHAVDWAADNFSWTGGDYAKVMIMITDEDSDYPDTYTYGGLQGEAALNQKMLNEDILLNVITSASLFHVWDETAFSKGDYIGLFDLGYLRSNPADFTEEFTSAKINEIHEYVATGATAPVPEPATLVLLGVGLISLGCVIKKQKCNALTN